MFAAIASLIQILNTVAWVLVPSIALLAILYVLVRLKGARGRKVPVVLIEPHENMIRIVEAEPTEPGVLISSKKKCIILVPPATRRFIINGRLGYVALGMGNLGLAADPDIILSLGATEEERISNIVDLLNRMYKSPVVRKTLPLTTTLSVSVAVNPSRAAQKMITALGGLIESGMRSIIMSSRRESELHKIIERMYATKATLTYKTMIGIMLVIMALAIAIAIMGSIKP